MVLPENPQNERTAHRDAVDVWPRAWTYGQSVTRKPYFHQPSHSSCFFVIELCFSRNRTDDRFFSQCSRLWSLKGITWRSFTTRVSTNSHECFIVTFPAVHMYFICIKHAYFATLMKYILELLGTLFCKKRVSVNNIIMRLVKLCL